jgi:hypothetical protein
MNQNNKLKTLGYIAAVFASTGALMLVFRGCQNYSNKKISHPAYAAVSYATGSSGHIEYAKYRDGSQDVKIEPEYNYSERLFYQDLDGDGRVDRIRINKGSTSNYCLDTILVRENDYEKNKEMFDEADRTLKGLAEKFRE